MLNRITPKVDFREITNDRIFFCIFLKWYCLYKQYHLRKIRKEIRSLVISLKSTLGVILFNTVTRQVEVAIQSRLLSIKKRHQKKINNLRNNKRNCNTVADTPQLVRNTVYNFSLYILSHDKELALMYGMDQHIPNHLRSNAIKTESELFYQQLLKNIEHLPENTISQIKKITTNL